jgi:hypothetical protein
LPSRRPTETLPRVRAVRPATLVAVFVLLLVVVPSLAVPAPERVVGSAPAAAFVGDHHVKVIRLVGRADHLAVRIRLRCGKGATALLTLDRRVVVRRRIARRRVREIVVAFVTPAGRHRVALTSRGGTSPGCRRPLGTGAVRFLARGGVGPISGHDPSTGAALGPGGVTGTMPVDPDTTVSATSPPATTPPAGPARPKLAWTPPALSSPTTITVAQGDQRINLDTTKDYIIKLGASTHAGGVGLSGGRNVVVIGGRIAPPAGSGMAVGLGISNATGTVHVEGVWFDGTSGREFDAIQVNAPKATVQLENIRATGLRGSYDTNHTDIVQPWGGVARLRVDRLTATTNYQGVFNQPDLGPVGPVELRHVDLAYDNVGAKTGGYLLWFTNGCDAARTTLTEVYVKGRPGSSLGSTVWPPTGQATNCPAVVSGATVSWPSLPITGVARWGAPPSGSFVVPADAGTAYHSPGYS